MVYEHVLISAQNTTVIPARDHPSRGRACSRRNTLYCIVSANLCSHHRLPVCVKPPLAGSRAWPMTLALGHQHLRGFTAEHLLVVLLTPEPEWALEFREFRASVWDIISFTDLGKNLDWSRSHRSPPWKANQICRPQRPGRP